ncbi:laccase domain-containing protein 1 [Gouania willdenowi]|uniref:Purine nucleoside phosphorylase LACC1 n=1 Tax=Gouania willdenowi TaxID=441366 RepID=A0A8C5GBH2_GOUWI|nr:laccase domain-containing protein 1 [Gouania willdenowi]
MVGLTMSEAVLLDLVHSCCEAGSTASLRAHSAPDSHLFLLSGTNSRSLADLPQTSYRSVHVLDSSSTTENIYSFKQKLDQLDLNTVRVVTTAQGRDVFTVYEQQLFTPVYSFEYQVDSLTCPCCTGSAHTETPAEAILNEIQMFLQQLPALMGHVTVLKSSLIPDCFGHGFSTRRGGVSRIPTLSSLNMFSSIWRRDPVAVVMENKRRLAVHAGFHPRPLQLMRVNHASDVWVLGNPAPERCDAIVTNQTGTVIAAPGADCIPILFADPSLKVIGVAHAGYKGTLAGVAMATVNAMVTEFGCQVSDIVVAVGPSVGPCCFTLERNEAQDFTLIHPDCVPDPESVRPHVDIRLANRVLLQRGGILPHHIHDDSVTDRPSVTPCTACHTQDFFSNVRDGTNFGTQIGFLWIKDTMKQT